MTNFAPCENVCVYRLLNGNKLTGPLPEQLGKLSNLDRIQIDQNEISGPIPKSFANLTMAKHLYAFKFSLDPLRLVVLIILFLFFFFLKFV